jgi:eukaryotic-like serine/threonine-protein kinase
MMTALAMIPQRPAAESLVGTLLEGAYRIDGLLSEGGMGAVYEATQVRLNKRVAVKVIRSGLATNSEAIARFHREAMVTSGLGHPHIVQVIDFSATPTGDPFLVMEFLEGEDLEHRLARVGALPPPTALHIAKQIAAALAAAHDKGIVHRDLKPANIWLMEARGMSDFVKVLDFGISKVHAATTKLTKMDMVMGSPNYMPPEQALGRVDEIDDRTDQWALGCIVWECLAGRGPFVGDNVQSLLYQVVHESPPPLAVKGFGRPREIEGVLLRALSKDRRQRFGSVAEFVDAFERSVGNALASAQASERRDGNAGKAVAPTEYSPDGEPTLPRVQRRVLDAGKPPHAAEAPERTERIVDPVGFAPTTVFKGGPALQARERQVAPQVRTEKLPDGRDVLPHPPVQLGPRGPARPPVPATEQLPPTGDREQEPAGLARQSFPSTFAATSGELEMDLSGLQPRSRTKYVILGVVLIALLGGGGMYYFVARAGKVQIAVRPQDARLLVDGVAIPGEPPFLLEKSPGIYRLTASRPGYVTREQSVQISAGLQEHMDIELEPSADTGFDLTSQPSGGRVWLDGKPLAVDEHGKQATTNFHAARIAPGPHTVEIGGNPQFKIWRQEYYQEPGQTMRLHADLMAVAEAGQAESTNRPSAEAASSKRVPATDLSKTIGSTRSHGSLLRRIFGDGGSRPEGDPHESAPVPSAKVTAPAKAAMPAPEGAARSIGGIAWADPFSDPHDKPAPDDSDGTPAPDGTAGCLATIGSKPWAEVSIDGEPTGKTTPLVNYVMPCGKHRITFKNVDLMIERNESITLKAGQPFKKIFPLVDNDLDPPPPAKTQHSKASKDIDDLLGHVGKKAEESPVPAPLPVTLPTLTQSDIVNAMKGVQRKVQACANRFKVPGTAMANISVAHGGRVASATVTSNKFVGTPTGSCVEAAARSAKFPLCKAMDFPWPFTLMPR